MAVKVTVAVPVYNVEAYLEECVDSVLAQTYENMEIILVDDGSPDRCGGICDRYAEQDSRVRVLHKENGGVSSARNAALDAATGEYILFVDSDDYLDNTAVEKMVQCAEEQDADLVAANMRSFSEEGSLKEQVIPMQSDFPSFQPHNLQQICDSLGVQFSIFCLANLYRTEIIRTYDLRFESMQKVHSEDQLFNICFFMAMRRIVFLDASLYNYRVRTASLSHDLKPIELLDRRFTLVRCLQDFLMRYGIARQRQSTYMTLCWMFFADGCDALGSGERVIAGLRAIEKNNRPLFRKMLRQLLFGRSGQDYIRKNKMDAHAALYFRFMILLLLLGKYDRPSNTYLSHSSNV